MIVNNSYSMTIHQNTENTILTSKFQNQLTKHFILQMNHFDLSYLFDNLYFTK